MKVAIIPARGGSKRIPRKNIRPFNGKPIIAYSIEAAISSRIFDRVIVSTDDSEIAAVAERYGAEVPFVRPDELSDDYVGTGDVVAHAERWLVEYGCQVSYVCCIYATAPFVRGKYLTEGLELLLDSDVDYAFSITNFPFPIQRSWIVNNSGLIEIASMEGFTKRSQDLEEAYHDAAQFYWAKAGAFGNISFHNNAMPVFIPRWFVQDLDTPEDWTHAEMMYEVLQRKGL